MSVVKDIVALCGGTEEIILTIKDMAGVGSPARIGSLVDAIKQPIRTWLFSITAMPPTAWPCPRCWRRPAPGQNPDVEEDS